VGRGLTAEAAQGQQAPCDRSPTLAISPKTKVAATDRYHASAFGDQGEEHVRCFRRHACKMKYKSTRQRGFPIGSGPTEGSCKSVVAVRCKRSSQRWFETRASVVLQLRALSLDGRLGGAIRHHERRQMERLRA
jgi:hypothetical protein